MCYSTALKTHNVALVALCSLLQVPEGVVTGLDAVQYLCSGAGKAVDLIYANLAGAAASAVQHTSAATAGCATAAAFQGDDYNPYDLRAVPQHMADKQQHWVVSHHGVTEMR